MKIENEHTFRAALADGINLFLGAGFSVEARDCNGRPLPTGAQLRDELCERFGISNRLELPQVAAILNRTARDEFRAFLKERFTVCEYHPLYESLNNIRINRILTTNIDDLLYKVFANSRKYYLQDLDIRGAAFQDRSAIGMVTLHGCILDATRELVFSATEVASAFAKDPDRWHVLTRSLQSSPTLVWGYSMNDSGPLQSLYHSEARERRPTDKWITVRPGTDEETIHYFKALGFQIIEAETLELLEFFSKLKIDVDVRDGKDVPTKKLFPEWAIPDIADVPVRPILEFYQGAAPTWYDIYFGDIHTTRHHATIRNSLNAKKHTFVVGVAGSGKTTLLMQVMKDFPFRGHKLVCEAPSPEKARNIINRLEGQRALIAIDNFSDSVDGVLELMQAENIQLLCFDRDYCFEIVSHRLPPEKHVIDITDLDEEDIQEILRRIPAEIRKRELSRPRTSAGTSPSIFEVIEHNIVLPKLSKRYKAVLRRLDKEDWRLLDFVILCSYVYRCRTPVSMDMLLTYFGDDIPGYSDIYKMKATLGRIVTDYLGDFDDGSQDYFTPRSALVAEAVILQADNLDLKRVITRFHERVSPYRIHRFDVFKRRAYDAELMVKVFDNWEEGRNFYIKAFERDRSPYVLQQGALYLADKRRFQEAFQMIDQALIESNYQIPSIRNSHAVILFKANINREETDGTVKRTLQQSMEILRECYHSDKRKAYHATVFADQALQYDTRFGRVESREYLETALAWLQEERKKSPWHREVKRLSEVVARRLGQ